MHFLEPSFLFALSAAAIPIIIHLFNFRRFKKVYFTNVRFLKEIKQETQSRSRLKHLLVLAMRILAISFLVCSFAQPYLGGSTKAVSKAGNAVSIYVDNSFSMGAVGKGGTLLDEAKKHAHDIAMSYKPSDKFQLLTNDFEGKHQRMVSREEFLDMLDEVKVSPASRKLPGIVSRQNDLLADPEFRTANRRSFLVSDFQKSISSFTDIKNDTSIACTLLPVKANTQANLYIDSLWFESPVRQLVRTEKLKIRIRNASDKEAENVPLKLFINGKEKTPSSFSIGEHGTAEIELSYIGKEVGIQQCYAAITDYPVTTDDKLFFSYTVWKQVPVLSIRPPAKDMQGKQEGNYIARIFSDSMFVFKNEEADKLDYSSFTQKRLIILDGLSAVSSGLAQELKKFVQNGGSLLVFPGKDIDKGSYKDLLSSFSSVSYESLDTLNTRVDAMALEDELFAGAFEKKQEKSENQRMDLPSVFSYYKIGRAVRSSADVLMKIQNGDVFLSRQRFGKGKLYLCAVPADEASSNFTRHGVFLPILHQVAIHSQPVEPLYSVIGKNEVIETSSTVSGDNVFHISSPETNFDVIPEHKVSESGTEIFVHGQVAQAGNYFLLAGNERIRGVSFNYDRTESDLSSFTPDELRRQISEAGLDNFSLIESGKKDVAVVLAEAVQGIKLWKYCILLALLFLAAEVAILRLWK